MPSRGPAPPAPAAAAFPGGCAQRWPRPRPPPSNDDGRRCRWARNNHIRPGGGRRKEKQLKRFIKKEGKAWQRGVAVLPLAISFNLQRQLRKENTDIPHKLKLGQTPPLIFFPPLLFLKPLPRCREPPMPPVYLQQGLEQANLGRGVGWGTNHPPKT